ncbi:LLM class flavin-dependent oxidoreductase, partial [Nocardia farcinica]|uniref:LLM class flavin-dependent oxidoreductase n=1 Tax=Nocardia farcinica TaxID=37329 RepID=UPI002454875D
MTIDIYWRIGMEGDHASLRTPRRYNRGHANGYGPGNIAPAVRDGRLDDYGYIDHMAAVARASESAGFLGGLLPSFPVTDDPWAVSAALARETTTYRFMVAFQPGFLHPVQAARMSASLQRATGGRLVYNIISGGGGPAQLWWGGNVAHAEHQHRQRSRRLGGHGAIRLGDERIRVVMAEPRGQTVDRDVDARTV